jgi:hypothetical protein
LTLTGTTALTLPTGGTLISSTGGVTPVENKFLLGNSTPAWAASAYTLPASIAAGDLFYGSGTNAVGVITKGANNSLFGINNSGTLGYYTNVALDADFFVYDKTNGTDTGIKFDTTGMSNTKFATFKPTGTTDTILSTVSLSHNATLMTTMEVDGHTDATTLTADQVTNTTIYNTGQGAGDVTITLPAAASGMNFLATVGTTVAANKWRFRAAANDKIYNMAADGTPTAGADNGYIGYSTTAKYPVIGNCFACWTIKTDAYDWVCKPIGNLVLTAE